MDDNFVDDDELQASLARARRAKTMKRKVLTQEEIARKREYKLHGFSIFLKKNSQLPKSACVHKGLTTTRPK